jgi:hypothetical protein
MQRFAGRGGIQATASVPDWLMVVAEDPDAQVGPFYRFYFLEQFREFRESREMNFVTPNFIWPFLKRIGVVDEQSAEERFRTDRPMTSRFLDRAVSEGVPQEAALTATIRRYPREDDAQEAIAIEIQKSAPKLPNAKKRELIGRRVNALLEQAIHQLVPILENRVEDSAITGEEPFEDLIEDPVARAIAFKLAEDIFATFPWFDAIGTGELYFYRLNSQTLCDFRFHPAWDTILRGSALLRDAPYGTTYVVSRGFYNVVMDRYEDLQRTAVAPKPSG